MAGPRPKGSIRVPLDVRHPGIGGGLASCDGRRHCYAAVVLLLMRSEQVTTWRCDCCGEPLLDALRVIAIERGFVTCPACGWPADPPREAAEEIVEDEAKTE